MNLADLVSQASDKARFQSVGDYLDFCARYLEFVRHGGVQAVILAQNEPQYQFLQYKDDGHRNITRPLNSALMYDAQTFGEAAKSFVELFTALKDQAPPDETQRALIPRTVYTAQQSIGAALDALPARLTNQARKVNGDLFERFIRLLVNAAGVECVSGVVRVPVRDAAGAELLKASYQHDLLISEDGALRIIGSVKTSSKDRLDKIFLDKFLYNRLTDTALPHVAIFLNDVQRANRKTRGDGRPAYGVSATFLPGHFKAYTIKLNPLDGVYYCDMRPNMTKDELLRQYVRSLDCFFYDDLWQLLSRK
jgi:hypothetical protein